jgi:hypothetical protein
MTAPAVNLQQQVDWLLQPLDTETQERYYRKVHKRLAGCVANAEQHPMRHWHIPSRLPASMVQCQRYSTVRDPQLLPAGLSVQYDGDDGRGKCLIAGKASAVSCIARAKGAQCILRHHVGMYHGHT